MIGGFFCLLGSLIRLYLGFCECFYFFWKNCQKKVTTIYIYGHFWQPTLTDGCDHAFFSYLLFNRNCNSIVRDNRQNPAVLTQLKNTSSRPRQTNPVGTFQRLFQSLNKKRKKSMFVCPSKHKHWMSLTHTAAASYLKRKANFWIQYCTN